MAIEPGEHIFRTLFNSMRAGVLLHGPDSEVLFCNQAALELLGIPEAELVGRTIEDGQWDVVGEDGVVMQTADLPMVRALQTCQPIHDQILGIQRRRLGDRVWLLMSAEPQLGPDGTALHVTTSFTDMTARRRAEAALYLRDRAIAATSNGVAILDARKRGRPIIYVNPAFERLSGYEAAEAVGKPFSFLRGADTNEVTTATIDQALREGRECHVTVLHYRKNGTSWWTDLTLSPVRGRGGTLSHFVAIYIDATERIKAKRALERQALQDSLTGLPNRTLFHKRVVQAIHEGTARNRPMALLLVDLDHFADVNDTLGHQNGDALIKQIGPRLRKILGSRDTVARLGGDEFALLLPNVEAIGAAVTVAEAIQESLNEPFQLDGQTFTVSCSIGIVLSPHHGTDADTLLRRADIAMYQAKRSRSDYAVYDPERDRHSPARLALMGELRRGIEEDQLFLEYQPLAEFATRRVIAVEALVRWTHPTRGPMPPDQFIGMAEQTGSIKQLTAWVLNAALRQCHMWQRAGLELAVAVNLSARNLEDDALPDSIVALLETWNVPPQRLKLEITESIVMSDPVRAMQVLSRLHAMGIRLAIDDFGTGHSSLSYLARLPADEIKLDKSFVLEQGHELSNAAIMRAVIDLSHSLGRTVVAEGVEDWQSWDLLARFHCDVAQGHYLSRALPGNAVERWIRDWYARPAEPRMQGAAEPRISNPNRSDVSHLERASG